MNRILRFLYLNVKTTGYGEIGSMLKMYIKHPVWEKDEQGLNELQKLSINNKYKKPIKCLIKKS